MKYDMIFTPLTKEQIEKVKEVNNLSNRTKSTHALIFKDVANMFGTKKQLEKYFKIWETNSFNDIIKSSKTVNFYDIKDFKNTYLNSIVLKKQDDLLDADDENINNVEIDKVSKSKYSFIKTIFFILFIIYVLNRINS